MKCAIYIRVSTNKEEQKTSLQNQKDLFFKYISDKGWDIGKIYIDIEIALDSNLSLKESHDKAQKLHDFLEEKIPNIKHCMVHVNPI